MSTSSHPHVATWLEHIRSLAVDIGPRPPTGESERRAAAYAQEQLGKLGLEPIWETFQSARSIFLPHLIGCILMLLAFALFPLEGRVTAVIASVLSILVLVSELQELGFHDNLYRRLIPKGESQNVHAVIPPRGEHTQDLVLVGHLDTQRTPFIFRSPRHVKVYDNLTTIIFITFVAQAVLYTLSIPFSWPWVWYATFPTALCALLLSLICIEADSTPFTAGANDNATGAGLVLELASHFKHSPLQHTRIWAVCTGCEEVQHYGMIDFYRRHRSELKDARAIVFEMLGCAGPAWLVSEGIIVPFQADAGLVRLVEQLSDEHPEWCAYPTKISGGNTEMADAIRNRIPAITITGMTPKGIAPYWHQKSDTFDKMDPDVLERAWELSLALLENIDGGQPRAQL